MKTYTLDRGIPKADNNPVSAQDAAIVTLTASELARRIQVRELSSVQVVQAFVRQIARCNPDLNAIVLLDGDAALKRAREADQALARGEVWGPLHGVPVTVKDTYSTRGLRTTAGAAELADYIPEKDAVAVSLLRQAGAILLAKTNAATLAMDMQTTNVLFGTTNNPHDVTRTTGGGGGGAPVAAVLWLRPRGFHPPARRLHRRLGLAAHARRGVDAGPYSAQARRDGRHQDHGGAGAAGQ